MSLMLTDPALADLCPYQSRSRREQLPFDSFKQLPYNPYKESQGLTATYSG
jgi:hypothetical protein